MVKSYDSPENIERCLNCTRTKCTGNCWDMYSATSAAVVVHPERGGRAGRLYELDGEEHTAAEWARIVGLPYYLVLRRLRCGWSLKEALYNPVGTGIKERRRLLSARGQRMGLTEWANALGINKGALHMYLKTHGGDMEKAVEYYEMRREARKNAQASGAAAKGRDQSGEV